MASKQLEILVTARDNASGVFKGVGNSAEGLSSKLGSLDSLTSSAKGFKSSLKVAKTLVVAYETIPLAIDAVKAAYATLTGSAEEAAAGQRTLLEGIRSFPIVGKIAGGAAEYLGTKVAHIFGKQSTAEMEADIAKNKAALEGYAVAVKKIGDELGKGKNEVALIGLAPDDAAVEKAKQQYAKAIADLKPLKAALLASAGQVSGAEAQGQAAKIQEIAADAERVRDNEIAKANNKKQIAEREFSSKLVDITRERNEQLEALGHDLEEKQLNADNRAYEARLSGLKAALGKEIDAIQDAAHKQSQELEKQKLALQPLAHAGNEEAKKQIAALGEAQTKIFENSQEQQDKLAYASIVDQRAARDAAIRDARLASLRTEADAGDTIAKLELVRLTTSREQEATERALAAIAKDTAATDQQRADAAWQILELKRAASIVTTQGLAASELLILEQQAALGSESAKIKVQQLQTAKAQADAEAKINAILADRNSTEAQKAEARKQQEQLNQNNQTRTGNEIRDAGLFVLQQEAALGDKVAEKQLKKIQLEKEYAAQKEHLLGVLNSEASSQDKLNAKKALAGLDAVKQRALQQVGGREKLSSAATLEESHFLTGVSAQAAQERDQYQPIVDAQKENVEVSKEIAQLLSEYLKRNEGGGTELK